MIKSLRWHLLRLVLWLVLWLEKRMHWVDDFSRNDPEWNAIQNDITSIKNDLRREIEDRQP
ncbi:hypothetical protein GO594_13275 [Pseudomonas otitidis]|uniref:Uncharacterized protein n=1 Tax=Metapseudomonas otitidis TaxID=319939 RepID=A0A7X3H877_9GAMM|nr:hypothetical protein [Pseudomonas otitidis]MWK56952.1 hypothetical protein [Pseudomonas otitidis]